ncbi:MAG: hypothetical protein QGH40_14465 [bacterium]|jgi:hypothetical protein|nr:hypothetical protein [bacterium]
MTFSEKMAYLNQLPRHKMVQKGEGKRWFDIGTLRPWGRLSIQFLLDMMGEKATPMEIAFLTRREYNDVLAMYRIVRGLRQLQKRGMLN